MTTYTSVEANRRLLLSEVSRLIEETDAGFRNGKPWVRKETYCNAQRGQLEK